MNYRYGTIERAPFFPFIEWKSVTAFLGEDQSTFFARYDAWHFRHIGHLLASLFLPTVTHPDGKQFVRINDHWMPI